MKNMHNHSTSRVIKAILFAFLITLAILPSALAAVEVPKAQGYINDYADVIESESLEEMKALATTLKNDQGIELAAVTVHSTEPWTSKEYATQLFNEWGIGGPEDSGLLILLVIEERRIEVETGYGLEGSLPDGLVGSVIDEKGMEHLKKGNYGLALAEMSKAYAMILEGEEYEKKSDADERLVLLIIIILFFVFLLALIVFADLDSESSGNYRSGGGTSSSSGGFGGFGGGSSGGGGAGRGF